MHVFFVAASILLCVFLMLLDICRLAICEQYFGLDGVVCRAYRWETEYNGKPDRDRWHRQAQAVASPGAGRRSPGRVPPVRRTRDIRELAPTDHTAYASRSITDSQARREPQPTAMWHGTAWAAGGRIMKRTLNSFVDANNLEHCQNLSPLQNLVINLLT